LPELSWSSNPKWEPQLCNTNRTVVLLTPSRHRATSRLSQTLCRFYASALYTCSPGLDAGAKNLV
jgi:hypothetical protein